MKSTIKRDNANGATTAFVLSIVLLALVSACSRTGPAPTPKAESKVSVPAYPTNDAIAFGLRFAAALPEDTDSVLTQSKVLEEVVQACLKHDSDRAFVVARNIKGWQRGSASADVAREYALAGRTNDARHALQEAEAWCALYREKTKESAMSWVCGRIRQHIIVARTVLGETNAYATVQQPIENPNATIVNRLISSETNLDTSTFMQTLSVLMTNRDMEVQQGLGLGVLAWANRQPALPPAAVDEVVAVVKISMGSQPALFQIPVRLDLVHLLKTHGRQDEAEKYTRELETFARGMPVGFPRGSSLADVATVWSQIDTNHMALLFDEARQQITQSPGSAQPLGYSHIADCMYLVGRISQAQQVYEKAFDSCTQMKMATARLQRLVETCASMGGTGVPLTMYLRNRLNELAGKEEAAAKTAPKLPDWAKGEKN